MHNHPPAGAVELRNGLASRFDVELPPSLALDYPSTAAIATHVLSLLGSSDDDDSEREALTHAAADVSDFSMSDVGSITVVDCQGAATSDILAYPGRQLGSVAERRRSDPAAAIVGLSARYPGGISDAADYWSAITTSTDLPELVNLHICTAAVAGCGSSCPLWCKVFMTRVEKWPESSHMPHWLQLIPASYCARS